MGGSIIFRAAHNVLRKKYYIEIKNIVISELYLNLAGLAQLFKGLHCPVGISDDPE